MTPITITPDLWRRKPPELCQLLQVWKGSVQPGDVIERKHDGWRLLWIDGKTFTRTGIPFRGIGHIERALNVLGRQFDQPMFFDCEFVVGAGIDTLAQTKQHQESGWKDGQAGVAYVFDALPLADWRRDDCGLTLIERKAALAHAFGGMMNAPEAWELGWTDGTDCPVKVVPHDIAHRASCVERAASNVWKAGGEGVVIKSASSPYRRNRNPSWQKLRRDIGDRK